MAHPEKNYRKLYSFQSLGGGGEIHPRGVFWGMGKEGGVTGNIRNHHEINANTPHIANQVQDNGRLIK